MHFVGSYIFTGIVCQRLYHGNKFQGTTQNGALFVSSLACQECLYCWFKEQEVKCVDFE